jgi:hypothetical protein
MSNEYVDDLVASIAFEYTIFNKVANSSSYSIITTSVGSERVDEKVLAEFIDKCRRKKVVPIIEFIDKDYVVISSPDTTNTAILSKHSLQGFEC